jgi:hypothetical protein
MDLMMLNSMMNKSLKRLLHRITARRAPKTHPQPFQWFTQTQKHIFS